jgi:hypothetical protein
MTMSIIASIMALALIITSTIGISEARGGEYIIYFIILKIGTFLFYIFFIF